MGDAATVVQDSGATALAVLANDTDPDGGPKSIVANTSPANGTVVITGGGTGLTYQPNVSYCNSPPGTMLDAFSYTLNGGSSATVTVTVTCVNAPPVAVGDVATVAEEAGATAIDVLANDTDTDGGPKSIVANTSPANGAVVITGGGTGLTYQPNANYCNSPPGTTLDTFTYTLNGGSTATVTVTVTCVDDPPTAVNDAATVNEDAGASAIDVLANDTDPDGGPKSIASKTDGASGAVVITGGGSGLTYQPNANACGADSFTYTLNGGSVATVSVTVTCVNDTPSFTKGPNQTGLANQNGDGSAKAYTVNPWATGISAGPANEGGQTVDFVIDGVNPANLFTVQPAVSPSGVLTFTTNPANAGTATITLHVHDNGGTATGGVDASATQSFTIQTVNPPPVAANDAYTATGNVAINVNQIAEGVLQRGTDDTLFGATITQCGSTNATTTSASAGSCTTASASGGSVVLSANGTFTYNPPPGVTGTDHFFYRIANGAGTSVGDVSIAISGMIWFVKNDAPACTTIAAGCGRLSQPFSTLAAFQAVNSGAAPNPQDGHTIFLYTGSGAYTEGVALRASQLLIGQGAGASITAISGITLAPFSNALPATGGTRPSLTTSVASTNAITLGSGNTVRGLNLGNKTGAGIAGTSFGTLTLSEVDISGSGQALNLNTGTANASFGTVSSSSGANGVSLTGVAGSSSATAGTLTGSTGDELLISGGAGSFTYAGAITNTGGNKAVNVTGKTGGTVTLSGQITDTGGSGDGVSLTSNTGATINLSGGVALSTGTVAAFTATGGGTVNVTGATNTLATTTATALNVTSTTIGVSGLTFLSISANGGANGIVLNATGSSGGLTVTGTGTTDGSGGTIQNTTTRGASIVGASSVTLKNMNFTNAATVDFPAAPTGLSLGNNTADNAAIHLQTTNGVTLDNLNITGSAEHGINAHNVNNLSLTNSVLSGLGNAADEDGIHAYNLSGTTTITSTSITSSGDDNVNIQNNTVVASPFSHTGTINVAGGSFNTGVLGSGLLFGIRGTWNTTVNISGVTINNNFSGGVVADTFDTATSDIEVTGSTITNNNDAIAISSNNGNTDFDVHDNANLSGQDFVNISVLKAAFSTTGTLEGRIRNNTITTENGHTADGISVVNAGGGPLNIVISGNTLDYSGTQRAINIQGGQDGASALHATVTGNTIDIKLDGTGNAVNGILANSQVADPSGAGSFLCADLGGAAAVSNTFTHSLGGSLAGGDIRVRQRFAANVRLPGYGGAATDTAAVAAYLDGRNAEVSPSTATFLSGSFVGGGSCTQPTP